MRGTDAIRVPTRVTGPRREFPTVEITVDCPRCGCLNVQFRTSCLKLPPLRFNAFGTSPTKSSTVVSATWAPEQEIMADLPPTSCSTLLGKHARPFTCSFLPLGMTLLRCEIRCARVVMKRARQQARKLLAVSKRQ